MPDAEPPPLSASELRERAMARLSHTDAGQPLPGSPAPSDSQGQHTLHELRVHQIELELQNEELRRTQLELESSRQRWFELYDLAPVGYCTVSETGLILQVNLAAAELLQSPRAALAKRRFSEFIAPQDQPAYYALRAQLLHSLQPQSCEVRLHGPPGSERWVQLTATAAEPDGQGQRSLRVVLLDTSARRQAAAAQAALQLAENTQRSRSEFLSRVSHEFRTPLNAILGFSLLLVRNEQLALPGAARAQLQHIHDAGAHLMEMVTDLLDVSRAGAGQLALQLGPVDLLAALADALRDVALQAQAAGVSVTLDTHRVAPATVNADPKRLRQVLQNLLTNAVKYNRAGGAVSARLERQPGRWHLRISDTGLGMTPQQLAALFQPFNRLGRESAGIEGTGLGLAIARDLVEAMGGRLSARSVAGQGSEFLVELVATDETRPVPRAPAPGPGLQLRTDVTGRVLCVEDDPASQALVSGILKHRPGIALETVATGAAGIAAARRSWPRLLLLDVRLPDMPGLDVLKVLRQLNPHLPLRCLVLSAENTPDGLQRARAAGADLHLAKPIDPARLLQLVDGLLENPPPGAGVPGQGLAGPGAGPA